MEFSEMLISTGVDALIKLVREKGKVEMTLASRLLNIPISTIEEWAHALEEEGILAIEYQLTKIHLKWVTPSEEKVEEERAAFKAEKTSVMEEIRGADEKAQSRMREVQSLKDEFNSKYSKLMAAIDRMGKGSAAAQQAKGAGEDEYYRSTDAVEELRGRIGELSDSIKFMREQLEKTKAELSGSEIETMLKGIIDSRTTISSLKSELDSMEKEVANALQSLTAENADVSRMQESMDSFRSEFLSLKKQMDAGVEALSAAASAAEGAGRMKEEISSLRSSLKSADEEMKDMRGSVSEIHATLSGISALLEENQHKAEQLDEELRRNEEKMAGMGGEDAQKKIDLLLEEKKALEEKVEKLHAGVEQSLPLFENVDKLIASLSELKKKVGEERRRLAEESGAIFSSLDEEISTYSTFQKIKEKASHTLNDYITQLEKVEAGYEKITQDAEKTGKKLDESLKTFRESGEYKDMEKFSSDLETLAEKKQLLEQIKEGIDSLDSSVTKTAKQVKLLAKEAEILELRATSAAPPESRQETARRTGEIREKVMLSENEQQDFDAKREELRKLIKKLWEEE